MVGQSERATWTVAVGVGQLPASREVQNPAPDSPKLSQCRCSDVDASESASRTWTGAKTKREGPVRYLVIPPGVLFFFFHVSSFDSCVLPYPSW